MRQRKQEYGQDAERHCPVPSEGMAHVYAPIDRAENESNGKRNSACGFGHAAVSSSMARERLLLRTWLPRSGFLRLFQKLWRGLHLREDAFCFLAGSDSCHNCNI
jgi:hypothetical protein